MKKRTNAPEYRLENPISLILDKPREDWTRADLVRVIEEKQIERIAFHYTGLDGQLKELRLPVVDRKQAELILGEGERVDGSSLFKGNGGCGLVGSLCGSGIQERFLESL